MSGARVAIEEGGPGRPGPAQSSAVGWIGALWARPWPLWVGAAGLAVTNVLMFWFATGAGVFGAIGMWEAQLWNLLGVNVEGPFYPRMPLHLDLGGTIPIGLFLGAAMAALLAREFKVRVEHPKNYLVAFVGGALMGLGAVVTPPCNVGGFFSATMALSLSGPVMAVGLLAGAYVGGSLLKASMSRVAASVDFAACPARPAPVRSEAGPSSQPLVGLGVALLLAVGSLAYLRSGMPKHAGLLLFGALLGILFQRSRLCFASAFREVFVSKDGTLMKWVLVSLAIGVPGFTLLKAAGRDPMHLILPVGLHTVIGSFLFGLGMSIAGFCGGPSSWPNIWATPGPWWPSTHSWRPFTSSSAWRKAAGSPGYGLPPCSRQRRGERNRIRRWRPARRAHRRVPPPRPALPDWRPRN